MHVKVWKGLTGIVLSAVLLVPFCLQFGCGPATNQVEQAPEGPIDPADDPGLTPDALEPAEPTDPAGAPPGSTP